MLSILFPHGLNDWYDYTLAAIVLGCAIATVIIYTQEIKRWKSSSK